MTAQGVRRAKAALSSGCKPHPATAPAGSNRSSYGGDEIAEAFGMRATNWWQRECAGRNASERRASLEKDDAQADPTTLSGKADMAGITSEINHPAAAPGEWRQHVHKESVRNTGGPKAWSGMINRMPARDRPGALGWRRGSQYRGSRVTPVEGRGLSSRRTQHVVRDLEIGQPINSEECSETADGVARESEGRSRLSVLCPVRQD